MRYWLIIFAFITLSFQGMTQSSSLKIGRLVYRGGGDWYANPTSLPNLIKFTNQNLKTSISKVDDVDVASEEIFNYPFIHMTGHGNVVFNGQEIENLRNYLLSGGFLHIDDNYGMDVYIRSEIKKLFPEYELTELPFSHPIYHQKYNFPKGLPKIHEHDQKPPQGYAIVHQGHVILYYTYECDLGDGWEDQRVHNDREDIRTKAFQMGANILQYAFIGGNED
ncbi:MAG: DUF4159 domain-containing protein [Bacteroidetes bacterium]|jgi:hypothetical protein|nr:DUF4159 domain-containing protein [Bacteroidota bacterium]MBT5529629.1 DUF4159 domain-containing protein [Cytophagia bacterium]MBT3424743.1 DUF4159 domain-containing protein [Bacteroidota bacterium]MBT3800537.1 DUF4159 domain-containing protein [Bacteroidota bacterium]MBT3933827.1 DUF4159 domain-containing protein [Bacteroidota bacterium]